jgi:DNA gyrase subunit A
LSSEDRILGIVKDELKEMKEKFGDKRRTKIVAQEVGKFSDEELIPDEKVVVTLTSANYIKRSPIAEYKKQGVAAKVAEEWLLEKRILLST